VDSLSLVRILLLLGRTTEVPWRRKLGTRRPEKLEQRIFLSLVVYRRKAEKGVERRATSNGRSEEEERSG
jgi:hypothetical protein